MRLKMKAGNLLIIFLQAICYILLLGCHEDIPIGKIENEYFSSIEVGEIQGVWYSADKGLFFKIDSNSTITPLRENRRNGMLEAFLPETDSIFFSEESYFVQVYNCIHTDPFGPRIFSDSVYSYQFEGDVLQLDNFYGRQEIKLNRIKEDTLSIPIDTSYFIADAIFKYENGESASYYFDGRKAPYDRFYWQVEDEVLSINARSIDYQCFLNSRPSECFNLSLDLPFYSGVGTYNLSNILSDSIAANNSNFNVIVGCSDVLSDYAINAGNIQILKDNQDLFEGKASLYSIIEENDTILFIPEFSFYQMK